MQTVAPPGILLPISCMIAIAPSKIIFVAFGFILLPTWFVFLLHIALPSDLLPQFTTRTKFQTSESSTIHSGVVGFARIPRAMRILANPTTFNRILELERYICRFQMWMVYSSSTLEASSVSLSICGLAQFGMCRRKPLQRGQMKWIER